MIATLQKMNRTLKCELIPTTGNTVIASSRALIALLECGYQRDGSVKIPKVLQPYMGGLEAIKPKNQK